MPGLLDSILGTAIGAAQPQGLTPLQGNLPWSFFGSPNNSAQLNNSQNPGVQSAFFPYLLPDGGLWDKLCPYRLLVIDTTKGNQVVGGSDPSPVSINPLGNGTLAFTPMSNAWEFNLPISPQQLSITDSFSINTSATLLGVLEEHSGVRFKNVTIQGTFGIWPGRSSITQPPSTPNVLQSVFGGTIAAAQNVATQFSSIINTLTTGSAANKPITIRPGDPQDPEQGLGTGYYQTLLFQQFLEQYAEAKRLPSNAGWRLVLDIPKQNQSFVVSPVSFNWVENVNRPMEINYTLQLKPWRRINLNESTIQVPLQVTPLSPGALQNILNTIQAAQNTAAAAVNLIGAVRSDVDNILNIIRQTGLFVKQLAGVAIAASDLPSQLVGDTKSTISNFLSTISPSNLFGPAATDNATLKQLAQIKQLNQTNEGLSSTAVSGGQNGVGAQALSTLNPSNVVFSNPLQYPLLLSQVPVNSLTLNSAQQDALDNELDRVNSFSVSDLKNMRATILTLATQLSNSFGAGNAYYSTLFNQPAPISRSLEMTDDEYDQLQAFYELTLAYDVLTATNQLDNEQILNSMEYVNALAATSDIEFSIPNSKIQVPVPFGLTMEQIAMRYLGDPMRWLEIATLNDLREPYLDFDGFQYPLLSNADGRNIVVGFSDDLYLGQTIFLNAVGQTATARKIINIKALSQTSFLLTLDGLANLGGFTVTNQAYLQAYLPGTVNASSVIFVPSNIQSIPDDGVNIPASVSNVKLVGLSKVDWLIDQYGDLVINNHGDFQLAAGITNLVQALAIKFGTRLGSSLLNPDFGLSVVPGVMVSDTSASDIYNQISKLVTSDPRFSGIASMQVSVQPPSCLVSLGVQLSGISGVFPVSYQLPTTN